MRVKITRELHGSIDGIQLHRFLPGEVYDVSASLASYLLAERAAEALLSSDSDPAHRADDRSRRPDWALRVQQ